MKKTYFLIIAILIAVQANAQFIKEKSIDISVGYVSSTPYDDIEIYGYGFSAQGEYVLTKASWLDLLTRD